MEERLFWLLDLAKLAWADGKLEDSGTNFTYGVCRTLWDRRKL